MEDSGTNIRYSPSGLPVGQLSGKIYLPGMLSHPLPVLSCALASIDEGPAHSTARSTSQACNLLDFQDSLGAEVCHLPQTLADFVSAQRGARADEGGGGHF